MAFTRMRIEAAVLVPQTLTEVWDFLSDPKNSELWDKSVANIEPVGTGPVGLGWEGTTTAPSGMQQSFQISRWEPPKTFAFRLKQSQMFHEAELSFHLAQAGDAVRILHRLDLQLRNVLLYPVLRLTARRALGADLQSLKDWLAKTYPSDGEQRA
jgi:hypothetical protein